MNNKRLQELESRRVVLLKEIFKTEDRIKEYELKGDFYTADLLNQEIAFINADIQEIENEIFNIKYIKE